MGKPRKRATKASATEGESAKQASGAEDLDKGHDSDRGNDSFGSAKDSDRGNDDVVEEREDEEKFEEAQEQAPEAEEEDEEDRLQKDEDAVKEELAKLGAEAAAALRAEKEVEMKPPDPTLAPPEQSREDWETYITDLRVIIKDEVTADEEKVKTLYEALSQRIEDTKSLDEHKAITLRRLSDATKERDRCKAETQRALQAKAKLEGSCRELQQQKTTIARENKRIAKEEQDRHSELKSKFEQAIKDVQEKMDAELEVRQHFLKENEELRGKLLKFTETYEAQEAQLAEQREAREQEMFAAKTRLAEHEVMYVESKANADHLIKQNEGMRKSQGVLRTELQSILGKFDEFHEAVTGSNTRHGECKVEIDGLQTKLQDYEKDNADLKNSVTLKEATEEHKVAEKQRDALERLCDNLQKENKKLQEQVGSMRKRIEKS